MSPKLSSVERVKIVGLFYENCRSAVQSQRIFMRNHEIKIKQVGPLEPLIKHIIKSFEEYVEIDNLNSKRCGYEETVRTDENMQNNCVRLAKCLRTSFRRLSVEENIPITPIHRIVHQDLILYPYKIQVL